MFFQIKSYLKFLLKSTNKHGVHSPFLYNLITKSFEKKDMSKEYQILLKYRSELFINNSKISVSDFGAGSKKLLNVRKISSIAKNAGISKKRALLLYRLTNYFNCENILEIGTSLGIATASFSLARPNSVIQTHEGCPETAKIARQQFDEFDFKNINLIIGKFKNTLDIALDNKIFDLIYFDGNHKKKPTVEYFETCLNHIHNESVFIFDDIYWSKEMSEAWNYIKEHPKVTVTIDTFQWGIVFFRKEQKKEHFTIRV